MEVHDSLKLKVLAAENLPSPSGLPPTTYVEIVLGEWVLLDASNGCRLLTFLSYAYNRIDSTTDQKKKRTRDVPNTNNPQWNEPPFIFEHILAEVGVAE